MSEEVDPTSEQPTVDPALLETAKAAIAARGQGTRRMAVMDYPAVVYNELVERLCDRRYQTEETFTWLSDQCQDRDLDAPGRSSLYRFATLVREEYRLAQLASRNRAAQAYFEQAANGDPDAQQMVLNSRLTELLTDELLRADDAGEIETKRLGTLLKGVRTVAMTAFDKQKMDVRIEALKKLIEEKEASLQLKAQQLIIQEQKVLAMRRQAEAAAKEAEQVAKAGGGAGDVVDTIKKALGLTGDAG